MTDAVGEVGCGGNSGFQALNLAVNLGARRVVLVGFDMSIRAGLHWHGAHRGNLKNPSERRLVHWIRALDGVAADLAAMGVEVLNASPVSALKAYRKVRFEEVFPCLQPATSTDA